MAGAGRLNFIFNDGSEKQSENEATSHVGHIEIYWDVCMAVYGKINEVLEGQEMLRIESDVIKPFLGVSGCH